VFMLPRRTRVTDHLCPRKLCWRSTWSVAQRLKKCHSSWSGIDGDGGEGGCEVSELPACRWETEGESGGPKRGGLTVVYLGPREPECRHV
jgi:hypothetical protein